MDIFNIKIWGVVADDFMALSCAKKKQWIKDHTNQKDDAQIELFLKHQVRGVDGYECGGCKEEKNAKANQSKPNEAANTKPAAIGENKAKDNGADTRGQGAKNRGSKA